MKVATFGLVFCTSFGINLYLAGSDYSCGIRKHAFAELVYSGWKVEEGQWPWHAALFYKAGNETGSYICGATLISEQHVLTAAHCVVDHNKQLYPASYFYLHFGQRNLSEITKDVQVRDISRVHLHPDYISHSADIAILGLRLPVRFTNYAIPICLETREFENNFGSKTKRGWIVGWGITEKGTVANVLRTASMPVVPIWECLRNLHIFVTRFNKNVFCAGDNNGTSPGRGDSGGGMYFNEGDRWALGGIVSFAKYHANKLDVDTSKYTVFVYVQRFLTWIKEVMDDSLSVSRNEGKTISEKECERFQNLTRKRISGSCSNARYPHTVSIIFSKENRICTGSLLNEYHVLTDCYCVREDVKEQPSTVRIEEYGTVNISSITCHPAYKPPVTYHNLAIVRLSEAVRISYKIIPVCLANNRTENLYDTLTTTGITTWSKNEGEFFESDANRVVPALECTRFSRITVYAESDGGRFPDGIIPAQLCVLNSDKTPTADWVSYGALLQSFNTRSCVFTAVGVFSHGLRNEENVFQLFNDTERKIELYDTYSRVAYHLDWIEATVWGVEQITPITARTGTKEKENKTYPVDIKSGDGNIITDEKIYNLKNTLMIESAVQDAEISASITGNLSTVKRGNFDNAGNFDSAGAFRHMLHLTNLFNKKAMNECWVFC